LFLTPAKRKNLLLTNRLRKYHMQVICILVERISNRVYANTILNTFFIEDWKKKPSRNYK